MAAKKPTQDLGFYFFVGGIYTDDRA